MRNVVEGEYGLVQVLPVNVSADSAEDPYNNEAKEGVHLNVSERNRLINMF